MVISADLWARMQERRKANASAPVTPEHEGVAVYECAGIVPNIDGEDESVAQTCHERAEARPYDPVPFHHGYAMQLVGYDWERDV